ncbi:glycosyltransferase family 25 protein [Pseudahrensia aquimaris]|uniref:Glycosyltransferase family 25 protein n=1 Tax=Pseudahrensia aquimaris TaxID=744461 RepID=A0ABW3FEL4_9HYPH
MAESLSSSNDSSSWRAYVINLDRSPDRWDAIATQLNDVGADYERVTAIEGQSLLPDLDGLDQSAFDFRHGKTINPNELGCYLSHHKAIQTFMESDVQFGIILEDDADLTADFRATIEALIREAHRWDVANLNGRHSGAPVPQCQLTQNNQLVAFLFRRTGARGYMINRKAGRLYCEKLLPMKVPYDHEFDRAWVYGFRFRGVVPAVVTGRPKAKAGTTIGYGPQHANASQRKSQWRRGSVFLYRAANEVARLTHYIARGLFIPRS